MKKSSVIIRAALVALVAATHASAQSPAAGDQAVLMVNGEPIMRSTIDKLLAPLKKARVPPQEFRQYQQQLVRNIIMDMLLDQFLRKDGFKPTREEVEIQVKRRERLYNEKPKPQSFGEALRRDGTSILEMKARPDPRLRFSCYIRRGLTEQDIVRAYETGKDSWVKVRARHILIMARALKTDEEKAAARAKAEDIRARILAGEDFAKLAEEFSGCASKQHGGDLGFFKRHGEMLEPFAKAAFALEVDGVSPVVETQYGYHVIQTTKTCKGNSPLDEVREYVADAAADRLGQKLFAEIHGQAKIENPDRPAPPGTPPVGPRPGGAPPPKAPAPAPPAGQ